MSDSRKYSGHRKKWPSVWGLSNFTELSLSTLCGGCLETELGAGVRGLNIRQPWPHPWKGVTSYMPKYVCLRAKYVCLRPNMSVLGQNMSVLGCQGPQYCAVVNRQELDSRQRLPRLRCVNWKLAAAAVRQWQWANSDESYQVMKVIKWWKLSSDENYQVMKVIKWWKLSSD